MKMVMSSDWHLDQSTAGVDRFKDVCGAIDESVDAAIKLKAFAYLMNGDLTDPNTVRSHRAVAKATQVQRRLHEADILPIFVAGNHDVIEDGSGLTTMSSLAETGLGLVFEFPQVWQTNEVTIVALPFTATSHDYDPDAFIRQAHQRIEAGIRSGGEQYRERPVLIPGHLNLEGISPGSETTDMPRGRNVYWPMDAIEECFPNATVIGGHYHTPQTYKGVTIIGSMVRLRFDERNNEPGYIVVEI